MPYTPAELVVKLNERHSNRTNAPEVRDTFDAWSADLISSLLAENAKLQSELKAKD